MKILTFTSLFPNRIFPTHCVFTKERIKPFLKMNGGDVRVVSPVPYFPPLKITRRWRYSQIPRRETFDGIDVYHPRYFMTPKIGMSTYGFLMYYFSLPTVKRIRKEFDFDVIDAHFAFPDGYAAILLGRYFRKPVVVTSHGTDINLYPEYPRIRRLLRHTLESADRVIAVSQALKNVMLSMDIPDGKISVIPNAIDLNKFYPVSKEEARNQLGFTNVKVLVSVGSLIPIKGHEVLIQAMKILVEEYRQNDLHLVIIGDGPLRADLQNLVHSLNLDRHVHLAGTVPHHELYLWFNAADVSCLASSREGWPCVLLESLACGTPVVATDVWGIPEVIQDGRNGLMAARTPRDFADKINISLRKSWDTPEIIQNATEYTWERSALKIYDVYQSIDKREIGLTP